MASEPTECSAYCRAKSVCANGFLQTAPCWSDTRCSCGAPSKLIPHCLRDELPAHWVTETGMPMFYQPAGDTNGK